MSEARPHVLIVDDERFFREAIHDCLRGAWECALAETGDAALQAAEDPRIGVVVLDLRLPGIDGLEVLRRLRAKRPALRVIVVSAHANQEDVLEALRLDACDYLAKPLHDEELRLAVRRAAAGHALEASRAALQARLLGLETWLEDLWARAGAGEEPAGAAQIGARVCEAMAQVVGARKTSLMLLDADAAQLRVVATNGRHLEPREMDPVGVGDGVAGLAFSRGKAVVVDDVDADERFAGRVPRERYESRALAVVPVGGGPEPLGVLCATDRADGAGFGDEELAPLRILALQTAQLLSRRPARAAPEPAPAPAPEDDVDAELARQICDALTREVEPERLVPAVLRPVARALPAAPVALHLIDNVSGALVLEGQVEAHGRPDRERLPRDRGLTASVLQTGRLVASDHPETDPRFDPEIDTPADGEVGPLLCVPVRLRGKCLGVVRAFPIEGGRASARTGELLAAALSAAARNLLLYRSLLDAIDEVAEARRGAGGGP